MAESSSRDVFAPIVSDNKFMGRCLLVARLFTIPIFLFYILKETVQHAEMRAFMEAGGGVPGDLIYAVLLIQITGVALVALGYKTRLAALTLAGFSVVTALLVDTDIPRNVFKDLAIAGGFVCMGVYGPGPLSLDARRERAEPAMTPALAGSLLLAGRMLAAAVFIYFGWSKVVGTAEIQEYMVRTNPYVPAVMAYPAMALQLVAGGLLALGYKTRHAAIALLGFCTVAPVLYHSQFSVEAELIQFLKDFALAGGLAFVFACGAGAVSLDALRSGGAASVAPRPTVGVSRRRA
jgi:putative oxidoreductase